MNVWERLNETHWHDFITDSDLYWKTYRALKAVRDIQYWPRKFVMACRWAREGWDWHAWDHSYLYSSMIRQMKMMEENNRKYGQFVGSEQVSRQMQTCRVALEKIQEYPIVGDNPFTNKPLYETKLGKKLAQESLNQLWVIFNKNFQKSQRWWN